MRGMWLGLFMMLASNSTAWAQDGGEILQACETLEREIRISDSMVSLPSGDITPYKCWYFLSAIQQTTAMVDASGARLVYSCPGPNTSLTQIIRVFTNYARSHPEKLNLTAAQVAYDAMKASFPCK